MGIFKSMDKAAKAYEKAVRDELKATYCMDGEVQHMGEGEPTDKAVEITPEMVVRAEHGNA